MNPAARIAWRSELASRGRAVASTLAAVLLISAPAIWNGYPLVYSDTGTYVHSSFGLRVPFDRPPFYGIFLLLTHAGVTLWTVPLAQSAILVGLLRILISSELNRLSPRGRDVTLVALAAFLTIGTPLPWFTAQLVPDAMTGSGVLALFLMVRGGAACPMEKWFVRVTFVVFMLVHLSHLALGILLVIVPQMAARTSRRVRFDAGFRPAWGCVAAVFVIVPLFHLIRTGEVFYSRASHVFLLGRLAEDGLLQRLLDEKCPEAHYVLCAHRDELVADANWFIWDAKSPFQAMGGLEGSRDEGLRLIADSLRTHPGANFAALGANTARQLVTFDVGNGLAAYSKETWVSRVLADRFPREYTSFLSSRQQAGWLWSDARRFVDLHRIVTVVAAILSLAIVAFAILGFEIPTSELHLVVWVTLIGNASLVSNLSSVEERYQARLVWMIALAVLVTALGYRFRTRGLARGDSKTTPDSSSSISR